MGYNKDLYPSILRCFELIWEKNNLTFPFLVRVLQMHPVKDLNRETQIAVALTLNQVCSLSINRGLEIVHIAAEFIDSHCEPLAVRMAITVLALLCDAGELDYKSTLCSLTSAFGNTKDPNIISGMLRFYSCASMFEVQQRTPGTRDLQKEKETKDLVDGAIGTILPRLSHLCDEVRAAAISALNNFSSELLQEHVNEKTFKQIVWDHSEIVQEEGAELIGRMCSEEAALRSASSGSSKKDKEGEEQRTAGIANMVARALDESISKNSRFPGPTQQVLALGSLFTMAKKRVMASESSEEEIKLESVAEQMETAIQQTECTGSWSAFFICFSGFATFFKACASTGALDHSNKGTIEKIMETLNGQRQVSPSKALLCAMAAGAYVITVPDNKDEVEGFIRSLMESTETNTDPYIRAGRTLCYTCLVASKRSLIGCANMLCSHATSLHEMSGKYDVEVLGTLLSASILAGTGSKLATLPVKAGTEGSRFADSVLNCQQELTSALETTESKLNQNILFAVATTLGHLTHVLKCLGNDDVLDETTEKCFEALTHYSDSDKTTETKPDVEPILYALGPLIVDSYKSGFRDDDECKDVMQTFCNIIEDQRVDPQVAASIAVTLGSIANGLARHDFTDYDTYRAVATTITKVPRLHTNDGNVPTLGYIAMANFVGANAVTSTSDDACALCDGPLSSTVDKLPAFSAIAHPLVNTAVEALCSENIRLSKGAVLGLAVLCRDSSPRDLLTGAGSDTIFRNMPFCKLCFDVLKEPQSTGDGARAAAFCLSCLSRCRRLPLLNWSQFLGTLLGKYHTGVVASACAFFAENCFDAVNDSGAGVLGRKVAQSCISFILDLSTTTELETFDEETQIAVYSALRTLGSFSCQDRDRACLAFIDSCMHWDLTDSEKGACLSRMLSFISEVFSSRSLGTSEHQENLEKGLLTLLLQLPCPFVTVSGSVASAHLDGQRLKLIHATSTALFRLAQQRKTVESVVLQLNAMISEHRFTPATVSTVCAALAAGVAMKAVSFSLLSQFRKWCANVDAANAELYTCSVLCADHIGRTIGTSAHIQKNDRANWLVDCLDTLTFYLEQHNFASLAVSALFSHALLTDDSYICLVVACAPAEQHRLAVSSSMSRECSVGTLPFLPFELTMFIRSLHNQQSALQALIVQKLENLSKVNKGLSSLFGDISSCF